MKYSLTFLCALLTGCGAQLSNPLTGDDVKAGGGAAYSYDRTADGDVSMKIVTDRTVQDGEIEVMPDGGFRATIKAAVPKDDQALGIVTEVLKKIPAVSP